MPKAHCLIAPGKRQTRHLPVPSKAQHPPSKNAPSRVCHQLPDLERVVPCHNSAGAIAQQDWKVQVLVKGVCICLPVVLLAGSCRSVTLSQEALLQEHISAKARGAFCPTDVGFSDRALNQSWGRNYADCTVSLGARRPAADRITALMGHPPACKLRERACGQHSRLNLVVISSTVLCCP